MFKFIQALKQKKELARQQREKEKELELQHLKIKLEEAKNKKVLLQELNKVSEELLVAETEISLLEKKNRRVSGIGKVLLALDKIEMPRMDSSSVKTENVSSVSGEGKGKVVAREGLKIEDISINTKILTNMSDSYDSSNLMVSEGVVVVDMPSEPKERVKVKKTKNVVV